MNVWSVMSLKFSDDGEKKFQTLLGRYPDKQATLLPALFLCQEEFGWISVRVMDYLAQRLELPASKVLATATFYTMYNKEPVGKFHIQVCTTLACAFRGGYALIEKLEERLGISLGETSQDGLWTLSEAECLASCGTAPMFQVTDSSGLMTYYENITDDDTLESILDDLRIQAIDLPLPSEMH